MRSVLLLKGLTEKSIRRVQAIIKYADSQKGYSLMEAFIALTVLLMLSSLIPLLFVPIQKKPSVPQMEETSLFFSMLGKEIREGKFFDVNNHSLFITLSNGDVAEFSKYHSLVRKQVNGLGHEVWVQNIRQMILKKHSNELLTVKLIDTQGNEYERYFWRIE
ncbi:ComGF family competence protein [Fictibacillus phosphorivorans]|uniref:ComGF family competence protein n=1 Tax=Fictibacillus phosphorivorans TaxID=1221500 RepID=UPI00203CE369|nr:ComGF family competence protein [Fictibacillus phosphorivorans]MCM3716790.1 ComGF family competence protein [Fictibacillus phosphorivorans]MCM3774661.1 ComGF family competence protein [Fictibacillus phosphorivorans]